LQMAEQHAASLATDHLFEIGGDAEPDAAQPLLARSRAQFDDDTPATNGYCTFCGHDDAEPRAQPLTGEDVIRNLVQIERNLGDEDDVGAAGNTGMQGDPSGVAAHHFGHHDTMVRFRRRVQPIDGIGREAHRGVEAEGARGLDDVVVDRFRDTDEWDAPPVELVRDRERAVAADHDQRIQIETMKGVGALCRTIPQRPGRVRTGEGIALVGRPEDGAAAPQDTGRIFRRQGPPVVRLEQAGETILDANRFCTMDRGRLDYRPDHGVQPRCVSSARQDANPHILWVSKGGTRDRSPASADSDRASTEPRRLRRSFGQARIRVVVCGMTEESCVDQEVEDLPAGGLVESPQALRLLTREAEARHLEEFAAHPLEQRIRHPPARADHGLGAFAWREALRTPRKTRAERGARSRSRCVSLGWRENHLPCHRGTFLLEETVECV
jgi:hypothetical protein